MVASVVRQRQIPLRVVRPSELAPPHDQRVVEHPTLLEIGDEAVPRAIDIGTLSLDRAGQAAVMVPAGMVELDESHVPLGQSPREQAVGGERSRRLGLVAIEFERRGGLL